MSEPNVGTGWQSFYRILVVGLLVAILVVQVSGFRLASPRLPAADLHTAALNWPPTVIAAHDRISGYVGNWTWTSDVRVLAVQVWMGNPLGITWEGDVYVTLNGQGKFNNSTDEGIVYYQFDKHAESSTPHQLFLPIGSGTSGFLVKTGQTVWIWREFNNLSDAPAFSGDGQVVIYYEAG